MADILIKGLALPKEVQCCYTIYPNGHVIYHWDGKVFGEATAIELRQHGRLIDADELLASDAIDWGEDSWYGIKNAPTVLEGNYGSDN